MNGDRASGKVIEQVGAKGELRLEIDTGLPLAAEQSKSAVGSREQHNDDKCLY